jgi:hypothetical protein
VNFHRIICIAVVYIAVSVSAGFFKDYNEIELSALFSATIMGTLTASSGRVFRYTPVEAPSRLQPCSPNGSLLVNSRGASRAKEPNYCGPGPLSHHSHSADCVNCVYLSTSYMHFFKNIHCYLKNN